jgi:hypothetical protein
MGVAQDVEASKDECHECCILLIMIYIIILHPLCRADVWVSNTNTYIYVHDVHCTSVHCIYIVNMMD